MGILAVLGTRWELYTLLCEPKDTLLSFMIFPFKITSDNSDIATDNPTIIEFYCQIFKNH